MGDFAYCFFFLCTLTRKSCLHSKSSSCQLVSYIIIIIICIIVEVVLVVVSNVIITVIDHNNNNYNSIDSFKEQLKTYFYDLAFSSFYPSFETIVFMLWCILFHVFDFIVKHLELHYCVWKELYKLKCIIIVVGVLNVIIKAKVKNLLKVIWRSEIEKL